MRKKIATKTELICFVLAALGPQPKVALLRAAHALGGSKIAFKKTSNNCYFVPGSTLLGYPSLLGRGLIKVAYKNRNTIWYDLTDAGCRIAHEYSVRMTVEQNFTLISQAVDSAYV